MMIKKLFYCASLSLFLLSIIAGCNIKTDAFGENLADLNITAGEINVSVTATFLASFSEAVYPNTVNQRTFFVVQDNSADTSINLSTSNSMDFCVPDEALEGNIECAQDRFSCTLTLDEAMAYQSNYILCLTNGITFLKPLSNNYFKGIARPFSTQAEPNPDDPTATYSVGGTLSGLIGTVIVENNGADNLSLNADGSFTFPQTLENGASYNLQVTTQPTFPNQLCSVSNGAGAINGSNVTDVSIVCSTNTYTVSGSISGLNGSVVLQNNGGDDLTLGSNGAFSFSSPVADSAAYSVTVLTQPSGQTCSVSNGSGTINGANVTNVSVVCSDNNDPPTPGTAIVVSNLLQTSLTLSWGDASDDVTPTADLMYKAVMATSTSDIDTIDEANAITGTGLILDWSTNTLTTNVSSLTENMSYVFAVLVRDDANQMALYTPISVTTPATPPAQDLIAYWQFENNLDDSSGNNNDGTAEGNLAFSTSIVKFGTYSVAFNGIDAWVSTAVTFNGVTDFTAAGWVYPGYSSTSLDPRIGFWGQNDLIEMGFPTTPNPTTNHVAFWAAGSSDAVDPDSLPLQAWSHIAITGSSTGGTQLFVNGVLVAINTDISGSSSPDFFNMAHGIWDPPSNSSQPYFNGYMDELAIWSRVLTNQEIEDLANQ